MKRIQKFRDLEFWQEARKALKEIELDPNAIAEIGESEGDSLDLVMTVMALEEAFEGRPKKVAWGRE